MELYSQPRKNAADSKGGQVVDLPLPPLPGQHYETPRSHPLPYVGPDTVTPTAGEGDDGFTNHLYEDMRNGAAGSRQGAANCSSFGDRTPAGRQSSTNPMYATPSEVSVDDTTSEYLYSNHQPAQNNTIYENTKSDDGGCPKSRLTTLVVMVLVLLSLSLSIAALVVILSAPPKSSTAASDVIVGNKEPLLSSTAQLNRTNDMQGELAKLKDQIRRMNSSIYNMLTKVSTRKCLDSHSILNPHSGECIRLVTTDNNWTEARQYCLSHGETMATFKTLQSVEWLSKLLRDKKTEAWGAYSIYIGLYHDDTSWKWIDNSTVQESSDIWNAGDPHNSNIGSCGCMKYGHSARVYDCDCSERRYSLCQSQ